MKKYNIRIIMRQINGCIDRNRDTIIEIEESIDIYLENIYNNISNKSFIKVGNGLFRSEDIQQVLAILYT